ncbi:zinc-binding dehydrogenase [Paenibacillus sp. ACRSA]|uniref:quinone oxidoreductase family protein n=1 Tax=Paenibacillus sp. ACRSA TaxID=2918211 RepID=UPI001EF43240|nr:zinc-binding dehydrogenase [Paenibacillus sp. ACRSA]MCG7377862.1 zinc-binding dehydrogenase [Paenibacillus sp. ACRSA]
MKAMIHAQHTGRQGLQLTTTTAQAPLEGEVQIQLKSAGINHRDLFIMAAHTAQDEPLILGSDGAGIIVEIGTGVHDLSVGDEVVVHPTLYWEHAVDVPTVPDIVGGPTHGTLAQYITLPARNVLPKPSHLSWEEAGVLSLSALTAYRALFTRGALQPGEHILIPGIGGGVATYALLMAVAAGAKVTVTSRSEAKRNQALHLGASQALDSHEDWHLYGDLETVDMILDSIGQAMFPKYFDIIKPGGRIVMYGASSGDDLTVPIRAIFFPQVSLIGTSMGSREEFVQMLQWLEKHDIHPVIDRIYSLQNSAEAFERMANGEQFGNLAIVMD